MTPLEIENRVNLVKEWKTQSDILAVRLANRHILVQHAVTVNKQSRPFFQVDIHINIAQSDRDFGIIELLARVKNFPVLVDSDVIELTNKFAE